MKSKVAMGLLAATLLFCVSTPALGDESTVLRVLVVETDNVEAYVQELQRGRAMLKRLESPGVIRVWKARYAGREAGTVVVSIEFPSLTALAEDQARLAADTEFQTWLKGLDKIRKIVSDSLYDELNY